MQRPLHNSKLKKTLSLICGTWAFLFLLIFSSCTNNVIQSSDAKLSIIFDYASYDELPRARLSVFVEAVSNPNRMESISLSCDKKEYVWESDNLVRAQNNEVKYCGLTNLVMPENEKIPAGEYSITYIQSDNEKKEMKASLNYDSGFYDIKAADVGNLMQRYMGARMLTVYGEDNKILYYGPRSSQYSDARGIWNEYREAQEFQESWVSSAGNIICNLPVEKVIPGN